jgi:flavin-dependent dehydrogenase
MRIDARRWWHWGLEAAPGVRERLHRTTVGLEEVRIVPAFPRLLRTMYGTEWFAIGDAAATHDPLSGHGIEYALESAFRAAEMASVDVPLERLGPVYQEAITGRFARHIVNRARAYAEAAPMFPGAPFWREMTAMAA